MSYLSQLAARTLNQLPSLQPRLPTRFESVRHAVQPEATAPLEYATFTSSAPSIPAMVAASPPEPIARELPPSAAADAPPPAAAPTPYPSLDVAPVNTTLVYQAAPRVDAQNQQPIPPAPASVIEHTSVIQLLEQHSTTTSLILPAAEQHALPEQRTPIEHDHTLAPVPIAPPQARAAVPSVPPQERAAVPRVAPQITPYIPPAPEYAPRPETAPVIQVSIGRIEVRAIHTPVPNAQPQPLAKPSLSLDDYLRGVR
jgi:hypothetical protein